MRHCEHPGCNKLGANTGKKRKDGTVSRRRYCSFHHSARIAAKHGLRTKDEVTAKKAGFPSYVDYKNHMLGQLAVRNGFNDKTDYTRHIKLELAKRNGFDDVADYKNSTHPYRRYRKDYCENIDGRLTYQGVNFTCTATIVSKAQLQVDHIDGDA